MNELLLSAYTNKVIEQNNELKKQLEAYENMRKEAIEYIEKGKSIINSLILSEIQTQYLLNILNKVGEDNDTN